MVQHKSAAALADSTASITSSLHAAGAHLWPTDILKTYMDAQIAANPPNFWYRNEYRIDAAGAFSCVAFLAFLVLACTFWGTAKLAELATPLNPFVFGAIAEVLPTFAFWSTLPMILCMAIVVAVLLIFDKAEAVEPAFWNSTSPEFYFGHVPEEAKLLMATLREFRPDVTFTIVELIQVTRELDDPVLCAHFHEGDQVVYSAAVLVWDNNGIVPIPAAA